MGHNLPDPQVILYSSALLLGGWALVVVAAALSGGTAAEMPSQALMAGFSLAGALSFFRLARYISRPPQVVPRVARPERRSKAA